MSVRHAALTFGPPISRAPPPQPSPQPEHEPEPFSWGPPRFGAGFEDIAPDAAPGYRVRGDAVWALARADYLDDFQAAEVCRRHGLGLSALRARARREGWRRADQPDMSAHVPADAQADEPGCADAADDPDAPRPQACDLAEAAWRAGARAIARGRVYEARAWMRLAREMTAQAREDRRIADNIAITAALEAVKTAKAAVASEPEVEPATRIQPAREDVHPVHSKTRVHIAPERHAEPPAGPPPAAAEPFDLAANLAELDAITADLDALDGDEADNALVRHAIAEVRKALMAAAGCDIGGADDDDGDDADWADWEDGNEPAEP